MPKIETLRKQWFALEKKFQATDPNVPEREQLWAKLANINEKLYNELRKKYLTKKLPGEFLDITEEEKIFLLSIRTDDGVIEEIHLPKSDITDTAKRSLKHLHEYAKRLKTHEGKQRQYSYNEIIKYDLYTAWWPDLYATYKKSGKEALGQFFEKHDSKQNNNTTEHGKLKERVEQFAKRDGCQPGKTVPSAKIQKWVRELKQEGIPTKETSIRSILQRLGYTKERKLK